MPFKMSADRMLGYDIPLVNSSDVGSMSASIDVENSFLLILLISLGLVEPNHLRKVCYMKSFNLHLIDSGYKVELVL